MQDLVKAGTNATAAREASTAGENAFCRRATPFSSAKWSECLKLGHHAAYFKAELEVGNGTSGANFKELGCFFDLPFILPSHRHFPPHTDLTTANLTIRKRHGR